MKITALEIKKHEFEKSFRGYDIDEVNNFLSNLAQEWERLLNEAKMLKMQLEISEKEASKLKEVEMTLIKTLRTAEDTSTRITENASTQASKKLENAQLKVNEMLAEAESQAKQILEDAQQKAGSIQTTAKLEFEELENNFISLELKKNNLIDSIQSIADAANNIVNKHITNDKSEQINIKSSAKKQLEIKQEIISTDIMMAELPIAESFEPELKYENMETDENDSAHHINFSSAVNEIHRESINEKTNLEIIEGIGPKIKEILNSARILTFRDLATTPIYRIKDILNAAGPHYGIHDPSSWVDQALLAEEQQWDKLKELKMYLIAGKIPKEKLEPITATRLETNESNTEEMLDKVNKVKAAIRKAMVEKGENKTLNDVLQKGEAKTINEFVAEKNQGGSFFDSLS